MTNMHWTPAVADVIAERERQIKEEGWKAEHDDEYARGEMAKAAACYSLAATGDFIGIDILKYWPWGDKWWKPTNRRRDLVKAGALILAEIERLDRAKA